MKQSVNVFDYAQHICKELQKGVLVTAKRGAQVNPMSISWGMLGIEWGKPIFITFVRDSRHTKSMLDETGEFTINIPYGEAQPKILGFCGTKSGRDADKIAELGLTLEAPEKISVPGIKELPLTLECKVLYSQKQDLNALPQDILDRYYPQDVDGSHSGANAVGHTAYYGQIVTAYLITE